MIRFVWTDDAVALLRLYGNKISPRGIAIMLGTTRNAVIGKARRCNIPLRGRAQAAKEAPRTPEGKARQAASQRRPEVRAKTSASLKAYYAAKRAAILAAAR